jgi:hypothetical protein
MAPISRPATEAATGGPTTKKRRVRGVELSDAGTSTHFLEKLLLLLTAQQSISYETNSPSGPPFLFLRRSFALPRLYSDLQYSLRCGASLLWRPQHSWLGRGQDSFYTLLQAPESTGVRCNDYRMLLGKLQPGMER